MSIQSTEPSPAVHGLLAQLQAAMGSARFRLAEPLARQFFRRIPEEDLATRAATAWVGLLGGLADFINLRKPDAAALRVFNPGATGADWGTTHTIVEIVTDDMPFLVDSVSMAIASCGNLVHAVVHPVLMIERDAGGNLLSIAEEGAAGSRGKLESIMHFEVDRRAEPEELERIAQAVAQALRHVRAAVSDWQNMRDRLLQIADAMPARALPSEADARLELQAFLRWVAEDHFTILGYREYQAVVVDGQELLRAVAGSGLGISRDAESKPRPLKSLGAYKVSGDVAERALIITKTNARSLVHRPGYMDYLGVLRFDANGKAVGEQRFLGLFTSSAYTARPWMVPLLRKKYEKLIEDSGLKPAGHSGKALRHILETMPRDELLQAPIEALFQTSIAVLALQQRQRTRVFVRRDLYGRFFSCLVFLPRDRFNQEIRERIETAMMHSLNGERLDSNVHIGDEALARLHLIIRPRSGQLTSFDPAALEASIVQIVRNRYDELRDLLIKRHGEEQGFKLASKFGRALPNGYIDHAGAEVAAADVEMAASLQGADGIRVNLYRQPHDAGGKLYFKLFRYAAPIALSEVLPIMENMGLRVLSELPYELTLTATSRIFIQDFEVQALTVAVADPEQVREAFQSAFEHIWRQQAESDSFNRLILGVGLDWRQVSMLRSYCKYLLQTGVPFSQVYMEEALNRYPLVARLLVELFEVRFDPDRETAAVAKAAIARIENAFSILAAADHAAIDPAQAKRLLESFHGGRDDQWQACEKLLKGLLDRVSSLDDDRILRSFLAVIRATLRSNYFQAGAGQEKDCISFKLDSARVPDLPKPRPYREIFVYSPRVEGVHLRFGPVARGGLRWSDRREDFRTEVLGLCKAQMVKNTVIVPVGSKGGFFVKRPPLGADRDAQLAEGIACYRIFVNALLDLTDNLVEGKVTHPERVLRLDADDPYLVVAADKGTATFSDIANSVSAAHGFWLGDAFASGGSQGYDHKVMGITAKGAWESVKRHFRALGRDCQKQNFTCVGIGDMSGDVFGNGMLLSAHNQLLAAFDHRHIFIDPSPNAAASLRERQRLFALPRSSWADYDQTLISAGGGIYPRSAKAIEVSPAARAALGIASTAATLSPNELMIAVLRAPVDLLWNGGIGTYVKAVTETHADCGDRANNAIRVNGGELRCKIIGEGGNLGMTQKGRVEAAFAGVLLNTDFIDNSAGVDTSDHEVNIKILLNDAVARGELSVAERNTLLVSMTAEVGDLVLRDNRLQNQAISVMERMSVKRLGSKQHFIRTLEAANLLDRGLEFLPSDAEFSDRRARGLGLTRPELCVLLSYAKIVLFNQMLDSDVPEDPYLAKELVRYFPKPLQEKYLGHMQRHRLRREIIATQVTNSTVNRMGATFVMRMQEDTGESPGQIAKAYSIAREVLDTRSLWSAIEELDGVVHGDLQIDALLKVWNLIRHLTRWLLNLRDAKLDIAAAMTRYFKPVEELRQHLIEVLGDAERTQADSDRQQWISAGFPAALAEKLCTLPLLASAFDIIEVAIEQKVPIRRAAEVYFGLGESLSLNWLMGRIEDLPVEGRWHALARGVSRDELFAQQRTLTAQVLAKGGGADGKALVAAWMNRDDTALKFTLGMISDMRSQVVMDYPTVSVALRRLAQLAQAGARG
ncbi:MAG: glutamate dehydrogenase [Lysobacterales bacterium CG02_land_8_20_14_3_00_62_12]|nr:MAG: glutamate dehydrogenase [Xanthomonadales bacterium CG02_land_8_20_14_3_00_62_12]